MNRRTRRWILILLGILWPVAPAIAQTSCPTGSDPTTWGRYRDPATGNFVSNFCVDAHGVVTQNGIAPPTAPIAPQLVQSAPYVEKTGTGAQTNSFTFPQNTQPGDLLVFFSDFVIQAGFGTPPSTVTDTQGNTWFPATIDIGSLQVGSYQGVQLWYAQNTKGGADTVTATTTSSNGFWEVSGAEYTGIALTGQALEAYEISNGTGVAASVTGPIPSNSDLVISYFKTLGVNTPAPTFSQFTNGFTQRQSWTVVNFYYGTFADNAGNAQQSGLITSGATQSLNTGFLALMWAFRPASYVPPNDLSFVRKTFYSYKNAVTSPPTSPNKIEFAGGNNAGDTIVVEVSQWVSVVSDGVTSITDTNGNTYNLVAKGGEESYVAVYAAKNIVGSSTPNIITINFNNAVISDACETFGIELAGGFTFDTSAILADVGSGTTLTGTISAAKANEVLLTDFSLQTETSQSFISNLTPTLNLTRYLTTLVGSTGPDNEMIVSLGRSTLGANTVSATTTEPGYNLGGGAFTVALIPTGTTGPSGITGPTGPAGPPAPATFTTVTTSAQSGNLSATNFITTPITGVVSFTASLTVTAGSAGATTVTVCGITSGSISLSGTGTFNFTFQGVSVGSCLVTPGTVQFTTSVTSPSSLSYTATVQGVFRN